MKMLKLDACYGCSRCSDGLEFGTGYSQEFPDHKIYSSLFLFPDLYWYINSVKASTFFFDINLFRKAS